MQLVITHCDAIVPQATLDTYRFIIDSQRLSCSSVISVHSQSLLLFQLVSTFYLYDQSNPSFILVLPLGVLFIPSSFLLGY